MFVRYAHVQAHVQTGSVVEQRVGMRRDVARENVETALTAVAVSAATGMRRLQEEGEVKKRCLPSPCFLFVTAGVVLFPLKDLQERQTETSGGKRLGGIDKITIIRSARVNYALFTL